MRRLVPSLMLILAPTSLVAADEPSGCVGTLAIHQIVTAALPEIQRNEGWGSGGFVNNQHHATFPEPEGKPRHDDPQYPVHTVLEFRFESDLADPEAFRAAVCAAFEEALSSSCDTVERGNLHLTCSFRTTDVGRTGILDVLPDSVEASARMLVVVASEW